MRCGWRLVSVDGQVCRSGEDLRLAMKKHILSHSSHHTSNKTSNSSELQQGHQMNYTTSANTSATDFSTWIFEVPPAHSSGNGPTSALPFSVISGQMVTLSGTCDAACKNGCKHMRKLAFRLDPNAK